MDCCSYERQYVSSIFKFWDVGDDEFLDAFILDVFVIDYKEVLESECVCYCELLVRVKRTAVKLIFSSHDFVSSKINENIIIGGLDSESA